MDFVLFSWRKAFFRMTFLSGYLRRQQFMSSPAMFVGSLRYGTVLFSDGVQGSSGVVCSCGD